MIQQSRYIDDVVERFNQRNAKPVENPCASSMKLSKALSPTTEMECAEMQSRPYRPLIGCLMYITTCTRPDIACVSTREHGIEYQRRSSEVTPQAFTDADWGSNIGDRRSVSGVMVMIGNTPVVFKSKFQRKVALSSAEVEYMALRLCTQEVL
ncbi:hypothetical protein PC110_g18425 [Phytophthora cactorum]|uniref:Reverse transcriptase Ty1/copia-type domain-containing protein n=2 Tax=Phytophthora cactorum TaxID=29920 RepID=A0A329RK88_9STRA|nr:hypothetical protein PC113_g18504 [Phytophthora cactorum]RAW25155.1 hypothetical protein PC110_g18425 [Phytophthora cactorum]